MGSDVMIVEQMKCGASGNEKFEIYKGEDCLVAKCDKPSCKSRTIVTVKDNISLGWAKESDGILAVFRGRRSEERRG
jgi:hypothetical protein